MLSSTMKPPAQASRTPTAQTPNPSSTTVNAKPNVTYYFGEDSAMPIVELWRPLGAGEEASMPSLESTPGNPRTALYFVEGNIQNQTHWILADSGSVRNLINDEVFRGLPYQPPLRQRDVQVVGGNGAPLSIRGFVVLPTVIDGILLWHEYAVIHRLPLVAIIGADIFQSHNCSLHYMNNKQKKLEFGSTDCSECKRNRELPHEGGAAQMRFVDRTIHDSRNRQRVDNNVMAVLSLSEQSEEEVGRGTPVWSPAELLGGRVPTGVRMPTTVQPSTSEQARELTGDGTRHKGKIQQVLAELKVSSLPCI